MTKNILYESRQIQIAEAILELAEIARHSKRPELIDPLLKITQALRVDTSNRYIDFYDLGEYLFDIKVTPKGDVDTRLSDNFEKLTKAVKEAKCQLF